MNELITGLLFFAGLFLMMLLFLHIGNRIHSWQKKRSPETKQLRNKIIEGAIFALMGLLIAFTFSGAHERFDIRRTLIINEANTIETTHLRLGLLSNPERDIARKYLTEYLSTRLAIYDDMPHIDKALPILKQSEQLQQKIWDISLHACQVEKSSAACIILLPAINNMIDIANTRFESTRIHPPVIILITLIGLALLSATLSGYSMRKKSIWQSLHVLAYATIISFTIFIIIDLEYPHLGFIHVNYFNDVLTDVAQRMNTHVN